MSEDPDVSYLVLSRGTPVHDAAGTAFATVEHVLAEPDLDLFDGIVVATDSGIRFVDRDQIAEITASAVHTVLRPDEARMLPAPDGDAIFTVDGLQDVGGSLTARLGRLFRREHWTLRE
ncbi:MAG: hypothetical protein JWQ64_976 [Subtercola sp.]|nr:hypothetical protein [Subtercola sp.]